ncbi:MAG: hypothetical protein L6R28_03050 [Planctomycetes bacterium]|nr:hypothetical protein [Planctomycetota bacterium]
MPQADENAGAPPPPQARARAPRIPRAPWLALGLLVAAAALATVWQRWSDLAPAGTAHAAKTEAPARPMPADESKSVPLPPQAAPPPPAPIETTAERKAYDEFRVRLDVSASDKDGDPLTYAWVQTGGPSVTLHGADKPHAWFVPKEPGRYVFEIRVGDGTNTTVAQVVRTVGEADFASRSPGKE